jgi:hypothetical protein
MFYVKISGVKGLSMRAERGVFLGGRREKEGILLGGRDSRYWEEKGESEGIYIC